MSRAVRELISAALPRIQRGTGMPVAFGGPVDTNGKLCLTDFAGTVTRRLYGLDVPAGAGLGGKAVAVAEPVTVNDYVLSNAISHDYDSEVSAEGLRAITAVPVVADNRVRAILYGAVRESLPIGDRSVDSLARIGSQVGRSLAAVEAPPAQPQRSLAVAATELGWSGLGADWEDVRQAHAELRRLVRDVRETTLRSRLEAVCELLAGSPGGQRCLHVVDATPRERDVLAQVAMGCTNAQIASRLGLERETVKSYLRSVTQKLGARNRIDAVVLARRAGILP